MEKRELLPGSISLLTKLVFFKFGNLEDSTSILPTIITYIIPGSALGQGNGEMVLSLGLIHCKMDKPEANQLYHVPLLPLSFCRLQKSLQLRRAKNAWRILREGGSLSA